MAKIQSSGTAHRLWRGEPGYEDARCGALWNAKKPDRFPDVIVRAASDEDVVDAVAFARSRGLRIAIRSGGHSMCGSPVRHGGLLLDLSPLDGFSVDPASRTATVGPAVSARRLASGLAEHGLAFPVGHCGGVPLGGYLLSGGAGWNQGVWGPACLSLEGVELVTANGALVRADEEQHADLFWAARGAGPGFFGVATRFHVRVYPLPSVIRSSTHLYPLSEVERVSAWADLVAPTLPATVELLLVLASAPPGAGAGPAGKMIIVSATAFADTEREAEQALAPLESCPSVGRALRRANNQPTSFDDLFETIDGLAPEGHRYAEDALWSDDDLAALLPRLAEHLVTAPSARSVVIASTAPAAAIDMPDAAFSMVARTFVLPYAIWVHEADDDRNEAWLREAVQSIEDRTVGHYVAEADLAAGPSRSTRSFAPKNWERLGALKHRHDPDNVFHTYLGLEEAPMAP